MKLVRNDVLVLLVYFACIAAFTAGWIMNIIAIINSDMLFNGMLVARVIGTFIAPLGAVLGWL